jgi:hypothetical protein
VSKNKPVNENKLKAELVITGGQKVVEQRQASAAFFGKRNTKHSSQTDTMNTVYV